MRLIGQTNLNTIAENAALHEDTKMDGYDSQMDIIRQELVIIRQSMDRVEKDWLLAASESLVSWYESTMREVVKAQFQRVEDMGLAGLVLVKERFVGLLQTIPTVIKEQLSGARLWSHKKERLDLDEMFASDDFYDMRQSRFWSVLQGEMVPLFGRFSAFLRDNGFSPPKTVCDAVSTTTNLGQVTTVCAGPKTTAAISKYGNLHSELVRKIRILVDIEAQRAEAIAREKELQEHQRIEQAMNTVLENWDNAFTRNFGQDIDWDKAWRKAENYEDEDFTWSEDYKDWLIRTTPSVGMDSFKDFLTRTNKLEKYEQYVRRVWKVGLFKSVMRQLGKSRWEPWIQRLIEEQVVNKVISHHPYYDSFEPILDNYREHLCLGCSLYSRAELCRTCDKCEGCCRCD